MAASATQRAWMFTGAAPATPKSDSTEFQQEVKRLGIRNESQMLRSKPLKDWVEENRTVRYVPESLLSAYGLGVRDDEPDFYKWDA